MQIAAANKAERERKAAEKLQIAADKEAEGVRQATEEEAAKANEKKRKAQTEEGTALSTTKQKKRKGADQSKEEPNQREATAEGEQAPPQSKRQREPLLPGNVWARACCGVQVAAQSYHDVKGCQGEAAVACKERLDALTEAPRERRKTRKTRDK